MPTLHWLTRDADLKLSGQAPYRLLEPVASYGDPHSENMLIQGDNLDALKALLPFYGGKVKCVCIDPPYNTQSAFAQYDDNLEHTRWLSMMYPRLELLRDLLSEDGSIWTCIDDNEGHYLKVIMDEVFGRRNFVANVVWEKADSPRMDAEFFSSRHDHILVCAKNRSAFRVNKTSSNENGLAEHYNKRDQSGRPYYLKPLRAMGAEDYRSARPTLFFPLTAPDGTSVLPIRKDKTEGRWRWSKERTETEKHLIEWVHGRGGWSPYYRIYGDVESVRPPETLWLHSHAGSNRTSKAEIKALFEEAKAFDTPKPERLIQRVLTIASNPGDLVLDSFLGSGTTAAVAHKMGRRWIGIEIGAHAETHCIPRMEKVVAGEQGGISEAVNWKGGGGFHFYRLGATVRDETGKLNPKIRFAQLAAHVWFSATGKVLAQKAKSPLLGVQDGTAYYLLFNGILGDRRPDGGNVLTRRVLRELPAHTGPKIIYGESNLLGEERMRTERIEFRHIPYDIKER